MESMTSNVERWAVWELALKGPADGNPFLDVELSAAFSCNDRIIVTKGFYDGDGVYRIRFMPDETGTWSYATSSGTPELDGVRGTFRCEPPIGINHGPVRLRGEYHLAYEDGTRYYPFGTTCYVWHLQGEALEERTLETLKHAPFNKLRMCVFPKHYTYNAKDPAMYPFEGSPKTGWDFERFNPAYFRHLEFRVLNLQDLGIEADVILFHPYDRWGFADMGEEADRRYVEYVTARLSAYRNVWWSLANEYDLLKHKREEHWDELFRMIQTHDPYDRLRSIHNWHAPHVHQRGDANFYDYEKPWVTHASIQHSDLFLINQWRERYKKPIIIDECCYEGNLGESWGNITAKELVHRFWEGYARGGYVTHGETYDNGGPIWWSHGGTLAGDSAKRIGFLRAIAEEAPADGIEPIIEHYWDTACAGIEGQYYMVYFGVRQPARFELHLPESSSFSVELIDTWEMSIVPLSGTYNGVCTVELPAKPYMALRIQALSA